MARFPNYSDKMIQAYLDDCARQGIFFWMPLWHDQRTATYEGRCYRCHSLVGITEEEMERTFWKRVGVPSNTEPKVRCDQCGYKLSVLPRQHLLEEMLTKAHPSAVQKIKNQRDDERAREVLTRPEGPRSGENTLVDIWDMLVENYGDLPAPVQMWLEDNDGLEQMVEEIRRRQKKSWNEYSERAVREMSANTFRDFRDAVRQGRVVQDRFKGTWRGVTGL